MTANTETPRLVSGAFQENRAVGAWPIVTQQNRRREAALRSEPLDSGHRDPIDCGPDCCGEVGEQQVTEGETIPADLPELDLSPVLQLWADALALCRTGAYPVYGSAEWKALAPDSPERLAVVLHAADMWRRYGDDIAADLNDVLRARPPISSGRSLAELNEAWRDLLARNERDWAARRAAIAARDREAA